MGKFDLAIFDMDGTLVDSEPLAALTMVEVLKTTMGVELTGDEIVERYAARELDFMLDDLRDNHGAPEPADFRQSLADAYAPVAEQHLKATAGAAETLEALSAIKRCLASNGDEEYVRYSLELVGLWKYFDAAFTFNDVALAKPAPDIYLHAAKTMGVHPARCIVIEDRDVGIEAGLAAGMTTVAFVGNNKSRAESFSKYGVAIIEDMTEFIDLALRVNEFEAMALAIDEAKSALEHADVPVGAVILLDGEVIARRHNERELTNDPSAHAELLAIRDASQALGSWRLEDATLVVTLEPCPMCAGALVAARVGNLVFGAIDPKAGATGSLYNLCADPRLNHELPVTGGIRAEECAGLLTGFFEARRGRS